MGHSRWSGAETAAPGEAKGGRLPSSAMEVSDLLPQHTSACDGQPAGFLSAKACITVLACSQLQEFRGGEA